MYDQTTKGTARKKAGISYIGKGAGILQRGEYAPQKHTSAKERIDNERDSGNVYELWKM